MQQSEILQYALSNGIIDILDVQEKIEMKTRQRLLSIHPYSIWEGKNGLWYTYLPDETKDQNRALKKRRSEVKIEDLVVEYWKKEEEKGFGVHTIPMTLTTLFPKWLKFKSAHTNSTSYIKRISIDWKAFYASDWIANTPITELDGVTLDEWLHVKIKKHEMTKKKFYNMSIILRQGLDYARKKGFITTNPMLEVEINSKAFVKSKKKQDETQVYLMHEQPLVIAEAYKGLMKKPNMTAPLGIVLAFNLGVRVGELAALKKSDFEGNYIKIKRMEVDDYTTDDFVNFQTTGKIIVDYTKSDAGDRKVYVPKKAKNIIRRILEINEANSLEDGDYLFIHPQSGKRMTSRMFTSRIIRYCNNANISLKSIHKIRKTYISALIDGGININEIRKQVGHADERTTYQNYCFNRMSEEQTENQMEQALNDNDNGRFNRINSKNKTVLFKVIRGNQKICSIG